MKNKLVKYSIASIAFIGVLIGVVSCDNDLDVFADYKDVTVIYGLLNPNETDHYVKITRLAQSTLPSGQASKNPANFEYGADEISVKLVEGTVNANGEFTAVDTVSTLDRVPVINKEEGEFYTDGAFAYKASNVELTGKAYQVHVTKKDGSVAKGHTSMLDLGANEGFLAKVQSESNGEVRLARTSTDGEIVYDNQVIDVFPPSNSNRIEVVAKVRYEDYNNNDILIRTHFVELPLSTISNFKKLTGSSQFRVERVKMNTEALFGNIISYVNENDSDPNICYRKIDTLVVELSIAGTDLATFMEVTKPSTGLQQDKPQWTNVTNGFGVVSSRSSYRKAYSLDKTTTAVFSSLSNTAGTSLRFCDFRKVNSAPKGCQCSNF